MIAKLSAENMTPLFMAICGSKAKGFANSESDYDLKMIVMFDEKHYMLQKDTLSTRILTKYNSTEVHGAIMDVMVATTNYLPNSIPLMYECMAGIPIYKTVYSEKFEQLW